MSNLPPGVTGFEPEIYGSDEKVIDGTCEREGCTFEDEVDAVDCGYGSELWNWDCPDCKYHNQTYIEAFDPRD